MTRQIRILAYTDDRPAIDAIRAQVFHHEQGIDPALEFDGQDAAALHLVAYVAGQAVGTTRLRSLSPHVVKIERVAVLAEHRGQGIGRQLMTTALVYLRSQPDITQVKLHAQVSGQGFYERLGFEAIGDRFMEAGIPHLEMRLDM